MKKKQRIRENARHGKIAEKRKEKKRKWKEKERKGGERKKLGVKGMEKNVKRWNTVASV